MNYLIKFRQKRDLRLLLRYNCTKNINYSSLYKIEGEYYILLHADATIDFPSTTKTLLVENRTKAEEYLFYWAECEILQSVDYIQYEQNSKLARNGRIASCAGINIYRLYEHLADVFAILNYTPDSFSDGGRFNQVDSAIAQIQNLCSSGASIIDLGVQSTRPMAVNNKFYATDEIKVLQQILPHVLELKSQLKFELSIDTFHRDTVLWLADFAVDIINDVSGDLSPDVVKQILNSNKRYVAMHSLSIPSDHAIILDTNINPIDYLHNWMAKKVQTIANMGCDLSNLILDPGIGFGLTASQSWFVLRHLSQLHKFPCEMLLGNSRKYFFTHITSIEAANRDLETAVAAGYVLPYTDYLRLHDLELFNRINRVFNQFG